MGAPRADAQPPRMPAKAEAEVRRAFPSAGSPSGPAPGNLRQGASAAC